ncbi:DUF3540 domain-containing protein [Polaromonas sp. YR568]|uniref:DUF3540 domain-containing protein n=1 Tax=Polaromonas sp. YR568 TaxID=1855301 RepID=UPI003137D712
MATLFKKNRHAKVDPPAAQDHGHGIASSLASLPGDLACAVVLSPLTESSSANGVVRVLIAGQTWPVVADLASACLLRPESGDLVLLWGRQRKEYDGFVAEWWVLSVLQRGRPDASATLAVPGAAELSLQAPSLCLAVTGRFGVTAGEVEVATARATLHTGMLQLVASSVNVVAKRLTRVVTVLHSIADTVSEHCRNRVAVVDEIDSTQAGTALMESTEATMLKGSQVLVDAKKTVRVDGEHILMG